MKKKQWVVLRMETKSREFQSRTLLAYNLVKKGYGVIITRDYGEKVKIFPKGTFLLNNIFETNNHLLKKITKQNNDIVVLDEEGLVYVSEEQYLKRVPEKNLDLISKFLCFGKEQYEILARSFPNYKDKFAITGNPRINLLNNNFDAVEHDSVNEIKNNHNPYILIVSNFTMVNLFGAGLDLKDRYNQILQKYYRLKFINSDEDLEEFNSSFNHINSIFESFLHLVGVLAEKYPDYKIIIRPHPSEDKRIWKELEKKYQNVRVLFEGGLTEWIKSSDLVIQNSCTSAIESLFLDKNCISYRPFINDKFDQPLPNKLSYNVGNLKELLEITDRLYANKNDDIIKKHYPAYKEMAEEHISFSETDKSVSKIVDVISSENNHKTYYSENVFKLKKFISLLTFTEVKRISKRGLGRLAHFLLAILKLRDNKVYAFLDEKVALLNYSKKYNKNKMQSLDVKDIIEIMNKYNNVYDTDYKFKIAQLDNESFIIE